MNKLPKKKKRGEVPKSKKMPLPNEYEVLGIVADILGQGRVRVKCQDGKVRLCKIRGKMIKRVWIREGDIVLISKWDFDEKRGDVIYRYTLGQIDRLRRNDILKL